MRPIVVVDLHKRRPAVLMTREVMVDMLGATIGYLLPEQEDALSDAIRVAYDLGLISEAQRYGFIQ